MFTRMRILTALAVLAIAPVALAHDVTEGMKKGTPELKSAGALAFGPHGVLFIADAPNSTIFAIATGDEKAAGTKKLAIANVNEVIGGMLGVAGDSIIINDMKVNPASGNVYLSTARGKGPDAKPVIVKVDAEGKASEVALKDVMFSSVKLNNKSKNPRNQAITSIAFHKGDLYVAGMTTEEWEANLKAIPFPFKESSNTGAGVQIYHGAHGKYETTAPIQTFMAYDIAGQTHLLASYTCTPLVKFPVSEVKKGDKVKGTTVAELGNRNRPIDIVAYKKDGKDYALIANTARGVMKVGLEGVDKIEEITSRVNGTAGLKYDTVKELDGTQQLDKLNDTTVVVLKTAGKSLALETVELP